jgi:hypothetical protein
MTSETIPTDHASSRGRARPVLTPCNSCGENYDEAAWQELPLLERIEVPEVRRFVSNWPEGLIIEVRRCAGCRRAMAAKRAIGP